MKITLSRIALAVWTLSSCVLGDVTKSVILCTTLYGESSKNPVPSKTYSVTVTSHATLKITFTSTSTITPPASTNTVKKTTTFFTTVTKPQITDTFTTSTTTTLIQGTTTIFIPTTITLITGTTITAPPSTTTIPTSPGFTPAASEAHNPPAVFRKRHLVQKRAPSSTTKCVVGQDGRPTFTPKIYPTQILCGELIEVIQTSTKTFSASTTATVTGNPPPPSSTTIISSTTVTATVYPTDASTTTTLTSTAVSTASEFPTTTFTATSTLTVTVQSPQATYYAACGPDNQLTNVDGRNIFGFETQSTFTRQDGVPTPYDCCVNCITNPTCGASYYLSRTDTNPVLMQCFLIADLNGTCDPKQVILNFFVGFGQAAVSHISTGNCGAIGALPNQDI